MKQIITLTTEQNDIFFRELGEEKAMQLIKIVGKMCEITYQQRNKEITREAKFLNVGMHNDNIYISLFFVQRAGENKGDLSRSRKVVHINNIIDIKQLSSNE